MSKLEQNTTSLQSLLDKVNRLKDGVTPTGTMKITENGTYDVTNIKTVEVEESGSNVVTINIDWSGDEEQLCEAMYVSNNTVQHISYNSDITVIEAQGGFLILNYYQDYFFDNNDDFLEISHGILMALKNGATLYIVSTGER